MIRDEYFRAFETVYPLKNMNFSSLYFQAALLFFEKIPIRIFVEKLSSIFLVWTEMETRFFDFDDLFRFSFI